MIVYVEKKVLEDPAIVSDDNFGPVKKKFCTFREGEFVCGCVVRRVGTTALDLADDSSVPAPSWAGYPAALRAAETLFLVFCFLDYDDISNQIDFIICLGGDGTLLYASSLFQVRSAGGSGPSEAFHPFLYLVTLGHRDAGFCGVLTLIQTKLFLSWCIWPQSRFANHTKSRTCPVWGSVLTGRATGGGTRGGPASLGWQWEWLGGRGQWWRNCPSWGAAAGLQTHGTHEEKGAPHGRAAGPMAGRRRQLQADPPGHLGGL